MEQLERPRSPVRLEGSGAIAELMAQGASLRTIRAEILRSRHAVTGSIRSLSGQPERQPVRLPSRPLLA